jgi:hypothetical protein
MSPRALILGLLGVAFLAAFTHFNNMVMRQTYLVGNFFPVWIYGGLLLFLLVLNPLLARLGERWPLRGQELVIIVVMMLAAATVPGAGLLRSTASLFMMPHHIEKTEAGWRSLGVVEMMPEGLLADRGENDEALNAFVQGMAHGDGRVGLGEVPWEAWVRPLSFWLPVILAMYFAMLGLALVYHRQWSQHEQLPYPIVKFTNALLPERPGQAYGAVFSNKIFWFGFILVAAIHLSRYTYVWFPSWINIPLHFSFSPLFQNMPAIAAEAPAAWEFRVFFTVIAISYFLAADVGLALGLAPMVYPFIAAFFTSQGIALKGGGLMSAERFVVAGAFFGIFATLVYTGRHYYKATFGRALGIMTKGTSPEAVWGARVFMLGLLFFVIAMMVAGMNLVTATMLAFVFVVFYSVLGRVFAETGLFFMQAQWMPATLFVGLLGANALGPEVVLLLFFVSVLLTVEAREAIMPFLVNALKLVEVRKVSMGKSSASMALALVVALAIAVPVTIYLHYNYGAPMHDTFSTSHAPRVPFNETAKVMQRMIAQGTLDDAPTGLAALAAVSPDRTLLWAFLIGLGLTLAFSAARLRFVGWPIHPVCFLVFCTYPGNIFAFSFLLGWAIKQLVTKYGGENGYNALKPLMFGLIAGELIGGLLPLFTGWIYYGATGDLPKEFSIFPR